MGKTLTEIAQQLRHANKKVQLLYAFNGTGKTRLSRAFKELIAPKAEGEEAQVSDLADKKILYYSAFTEDLFYWENDLEQDVEQQIREITLLPINITYQDVKQFQRDGAPRDVDIIISPYPTSLPLFSPPLVHAELPLTLHHQQRIRQLLES